MLGKKLSLRAVILGSLAEVREYEINILWLDAGKTDELMRL